jgi:bifunctional DNA-binding transcriptional regulator/antitoxin component of YhaV-PrlF toxin-antitoxin module
METTTLSSKGQLVIPKQVRQQAKVATGDAFVVRCQRGESHMRPVARTGSTTVDDVADCLASASRKPVSDAQVEAAIRARLKADDAATMQRGAKAGSRRKAA